MSVDGYQIVKKSQTEVADSRGIFALVTFILVTVNDDPIKSNKFYGIDQVARNLVD